MQKYIRVAALAHSGMGMEMVKVIFRKEGRDIPRNGNEKAYWMKPATYDEIPYGTIATVQDFKKHGEVIEATNTDIYDIETQ